MVGGIEVEAIWSQYQLAIAHLYVSSLKIPELNVPDKRNRRRLRDLKEIMVTRQHHLSIG